MYLIFSCFSPSAEHLVSPVSLRDIHYSSRLICFPLDSKKCSNFYYTFLTIQKESMLFLAPSLLTQTLISLQR